MITLNASGGSVSFTFSGNSTYLNDGVITCPVNSLALIADESDMVTFRKSASNDIFVSANIAEFGMTKDELIAWYKANMVSSGGGGGGGVTPSEVQTMIDESISGKADSSAVTEEISAAVSGKADTTTVEQELATKLDSSAYTVDASISSASTNPVQNQVLYDELRIPSGEAEVETTLEWGGSGWIKTTTNYPSGCTEFKLYCEDISGTVTLGLNDNNGEIGYIAINDLDIVESTFEEGVVDYTVSGDVMTIFYPTLTNVISLSSGFDLTATVNIIDTVYIPLIDQVSANTTALSGKADTSYVDQSVSGKASQSDLNTLSGTVTAHTADTDIHVTTSDKSTWNAKQDALVSGTNIKTINNESILGSGNIDIQSGGGKAVSAGTNISITTGETADTINCTLPISADTNTISINKKNVKIGTSNVTTSNLDRLQIAIGDNVTANGIYSFAFGVYAKATNYSTVSMGYGTESNIQYQASFGQYNVSSSASTTFGDSGNTLFSVGNGTANNARHNAFEVRQNGDIYITKDGSDVKLQDQLGGSSYSAGTGIDITNDVISVTGMVATSAVTSAVTSGSTDVLTSGGAYEQFGGLKLVKLTESEYAALVTKDPNVLYVVIPDPSNP